VEISRPGVQKRRKDIKDKLASGTISINVILKNLKNKKGTNSYSAPVHYRLIAHHHIPGCYGERDNVHNY
jgi:hypothetical protein